jgi:hypothetical protein
MSLPLTLMAWHRKLIAQKDDAPERSFHEYGSLAFETAPRLVCGRT